MNRRVYIGGGVAAVALVGSGILLWLNRPQPQRDAERAKTVVAEVRETLSAGAKIPVESAALEAALAEAPAGPPPEMADYDIPEGAAYRPWMPTDEQQRKLVSLVTTWLRLLHDADAEKYVAWMRKRDYQLAPSPEAVERWKPLYERVFDEPMPEDISDEQRFRRMFERGLALFDGQVRPEAVSDAPEALQMRFLRARSKPGTQHFYMSSAERTRWLGVSVAGARRHWKPPASFEEVVEQHGDVGVAGLSLGVHTADGSVLPMNIHAFWDPEAETWHIWNVEFRNFLGLRTIYDY